MSSALPAVTGIADPNLDDLELVQVSRVRDENGAPTGFRFLVRMALRHTDGSPVSLLGSAGFKVEASGETTDYPTLGQMATAVKARYAALGMVEEE